MRRQRAAAARVDRLNLQGQRAPLHRSFKANGSKEATADLINCRSSGPFPLPVTETEEQEQEQQRLLAAMRTSSIEQRALEGGDDADNDKDDDGDVMPSASSSCLDEDDSVCVRIDHDGEGGRGTTMEHKYSAYSADYEPVKELEPSNLSCDSGSGGIGSIAFEGESGPSTPGDAFEQNRAVEGTCDLQADTELLHRPHLWQEKSRHGGADWGAETGTGRGTGTGTEIDDCYERLYQQGMKRNSKIEQQQALQVATELPRIKALRT